MIPNPGGPSAGVTPSGRPRRISRAMLIAILLLAGLGACRSAGSVEPPASIDPLHLRVLTTHDFHGNLRPVTYSWSNGRLVGGAAALKTVMDDLAAACRCPTLRVDGGDQMQGTLESNLLRGVSSVAALNHLGVDAAAIGNHELDWGIETFVERQQEARYAWMAANIFRADTGERPAWAKPFTIVERGGVKVAVIGYATVTTPGTLRPEVTRPYMFRAGYAGIRDALDAAWRQRPDFVVVAAHAAGDCSGPGGCTGEMVDLAAEVPPGRLHLIAGGHAHEPGEGIVNGIPILRAGSNGRAVGVVDLFRLANGAHAFRVSQRMVYPDEVQPDSGMVAVLAPHIDAAEALGSRPVATLAHPMAASATGDRRLGHLIADAMRATVNADIGLHNTGGVRADLAAGVVSYADLHRVMPFDNTVVRLTLTGRQLRDVVAHAGIRFYYSNLIVEYDPGLPPATRVVSIAFPDGRLIQDDRSYTLATSDFLADGGDGFAMLVPMPRTVSGVAILDATVDYLRSLPSPVSLPIEQRVVALQGR